MRLQPRLEVALDGAVEVADEEADALLEGQGVDAGFRGGLRQPGRGGGGGRAQATAAWAISFSSGSSSMPVR